MTDTILVPLDGSPAAEAALPVAAMLAQRLPAKIRLLHVLERDAPHRIHGERHLTREADAAAYLAEIVARLARQGIDADWHAHEVPVGDVPLSIASHAAESGATLILLTAHGGSDARTWLSGVVAQGVIRHAAPPVLLMRVEPGQDEAAFAPREMLVSIDADRQGAVALPIAARLARALDIPLRLLAVVPTVETMPGDRAVAARLIPSGAAVALDLEAEAVARALQEMAARLRAAGLPVETTVARGDPAQIIPTVARAQSALTALATHGRVGLDAFWSGSVGARIIARGDGPFLLVHPEPPDAMPIAESTSSRR